MKRTRGVAFLLLLLTLGAWAQQAAARYVPVRYYDPARNAEQDLRDAQAEAKRTGKNILIEVGGNWCSWCRIMDRFFEANTAINDLREQNYVVLFVNFSENNKNEKFLSQFPKINGFPHLLVLDADGKLIQSQDTSELEAERGYNEIRMTAFLKKWAPRPAAPAVQQGNVQ